MPCTGVTHLWILEQLIIWLKSITRGKNRWFIYLDRLLIEEQKKVGKDSYCIELKSENGLFALIVQNDTSNYCLINITASYGNSYSTSPVGRASKTYSNLESLYLACYPKWHKVIHGG